MSDARFQARRTSAIDYRPSTIGYRLSAIGRVQLRARAAHRHFMLRQRDVERLRFTGTDRDRRRIGTEAVLPNLDVMLARSELHDDAAAAFGAVPALAVDLDDGVGGLDAKAQRGQPAGGHAGLAAAVGRRLRAAVRRGFARRRRRL